MSAPDARARTGGLRVVFAGTPAFARQALEAILASRHAVVGVLTQPDRPAGRGMRMQPSEVKLAAEAAGVPVAQPRSLRLEGRHPDDAAAARRWLADRDADVMVVAAYGLLLPPWVLEAPRLGCLNIHGSLLPRWRGAAPIQRAIEAGDARTGITIMQMDAGLDTGDMVLAEACDIAPDDSAATLHDRLAALGARMIVQALDLAEDARLSPVPQPAEGVTYARKIAKDEGAIDWTQPAELLERRVRAFDPFPGATARLPDGETLKVWRACVVDGPGTTGRPPGAVLACGEQGVDVACGTGALRLLELQRPGGRRLGVQAFLSGRPLPVGTQLELPHPPVPT